MALYGQRLVADARMPSLQPEGSYTVYACIDTMIPAKGNAVVPLGIYLLAPAGHVIQAMSGPESFGNNLEVGNYCSFNCPNPHFFKNSPSPQELRIKVYNHGELDHTVRAGYPIGQIVVRQICPFQVLETEQIHEMIANPPAIPSALVRQKKLPKQAVTYFKQLYITDYKTIRAKYLNDANLLKIEEYKKNPNYLANPNKENSEAAFAWGLLDRTVQDQIRAELVVLNEQEARVDQMAGSRLKPDEEGKKTSGKKGVTKKTKDEDENEDSGEAEPEDADEGVEEVGGDPDAPKPKDAPKAVRYDTDAIKDIKELTDAEEQELGNAVLAAMKESKGEEEEEGEEGEEEEEEEETEPVAKPAPPVAKPVAKAAAVPAPVPAPVVKVGKKPAAVRR